jgi:rhodanese-related sulfurtransferase
MNAATVPEILPAEAKRRLVDEPNCSYLDVRTAAEFVAGHAPNAFHIPVAQVNPLTAQMELNPKFMEAVRSQFAATASIIVGCRSGSRSAMAVQMMREAGFANAVNMSGGFEGTAAASGAIIEEGWRTLGYPVERGDGGERGYANILERFSR